jgi:hypothetical protein
MREIRKAYKILVGKSEGKRPLGRTSVDGRIILKWILGKLGWRAHVAQDRTSNGLL